MRIMCRAKIYEQQSLAKVCKALCGFQMFLHSNAHRELCAEYLVSFHKRLDMARKFLSRNVSVCTSFEPLEPSDFNVPWRAPKPQALRPEASNFHSRHITKAPTRWHTSHYGRSRSSQEPSSRFLGPRALQTDCMPCSKTTVLVLVSRRYFLSAASRTAHELELLV